MGIPPNQLKRSPQTENTHILESEFGGEGVILLTPGNFSANGRSRALTSVTRDPPRGRLKRSSSLLRSRVVSNFEVRMSATLPTGPHGGDAFALARALGVEPVKILDLSASLNPFAPPLDDVLTNVGRQLHRYPDDAEATELLANAMDVPADRVVLTNGGAEAIALVAALEPSGDVIDPEFSLYRRHLKKVKTGAPRWRSNPSNPLGRRAAPDETAAVWDEAFWPMTTGTWTRGDDSSWRLGSLTKLWACPGVRAGYAIAPTADDAQRLEALRPRWSVNAIALQTIIDLLPSTDLPGWSRRIHERRMEMQRSLGDRGLKVQETEANWLLVRSEIDLRTELLPFGILVRDCSSFGLTDTYRIAVCSEDEQERLETALSTVLP